MYQVGMKQIVPGELTGDDIRWLVIGAYSIKFVNTSAEEIVERAKRKELILYRVTGDATGMIAASVSDEDFFIECLAGKDFLKHAYLIRQQIKDMASKLGKTRIAGWVARDGLKELYDKFAKPVATLYVEEL